LKTIQRNDFVEVGSIGKVHGTKGELKIFLSRSIKNTEWAFLEFRGKPVPFYIQSMKSGMEQELLVKFEGIDNMEAAQLFLGKLVLLPKKFVKKQNDWELDLPLHYMVIDETHGELGEVIDIIENPYQSLAQINYKGQEILIPLVEEILIEIDDEKKVLYVDLPEGLLSIN
jgi:16S rRNA processing protein RimM